MPTRRTFLGFAGMSTLAALAGCLGDDGLSSLAQDGEQVGTAGLVDYDLESPYSVDSHTPSAIVDGSVVMVTGRFSTGSSTCSAVGLETASIDTYRGIDHMIVEVAPRAVEPPGDVCTDDINASGYRLQAEVAGSPPSMVTVRHDPYLGEPVEYMVPIVDIDE